MVAPNHTPNPPAPLTPATPPPPGSLQPLGPEDARLITLFFFEHRLDLPAFARAAGLTLPAAAHWANQPHIAAYLAAFTHHEHTRRDTAAQDALVEVIEHAPTLIEKRRAATTLLRALAPKPAPRQPRAPRPPDVPPDPAPIAAPAHARADSRGDARADAPEAPPHPTTRAPHQTTTHANTHNAPPLSTSQQPRTHSPQPNPFTPAATTTNHRHTSNTPNHRPRPAAHLTAAAGAALQPA